MITKDTLREFMAKYTLCVMATAGTDEKPEAAIVGFSLAKNMEILVGTSNKSRKYANLLRNPQVAIVIGGETGEVQYEGRADIVSTNEHQKLVEDSYVKELPGAAAYRDDPSQVYIKITPSWIRIVKHGKDGGMKEFTFDGEAL